MSPLEKMARAIAFTTSDHKHTSDQWWDSLTEDEQGVCHDMARAALLAIREPNADMNNFGQWHLDMSDSSASSVFSTMIDVILYGEPRP